MPTEETKIIYDPVEEKWFYIDDKWGIKEEISEGLLRWIIKGQGEIRIKEN